MNLKLPGLLIDHYRTMDSRDRLRWGVVCAAILILILLYSAVNTKVALLKKKRVAREADVAEMLVLKQQYAEASAGAQKLANRMAAGHSDDSPAKIIEETGIKGKNSQIRQLKGEEGSSFIEDAAEVKVEGLSANEAINLVYRLEKGAKPVVIKKAVLKTRFDDPAKLDITLNIALLKPLPQGRR